MESIMYRELAQFLFKIVQMMTLINYIPLFVSLARETTCNLTIPEYSTISEEIIKVVIEDFNKTYAYDEYFIGALCNRRKVFEA